MMLTFVLIAGSLAAGAAVLLLLPLMRQRADSRPAAGLAAGGVLCVLLLGGAGLYAAFSNYSWVASPAAVDSPAAMAAKLAQRLGDKPGDLDGWLMLGRTYATLEQYPLASRAYQRADRIANGQNVEAIIGIAEALLAQDFEQIRSGAGHLIERALRIEPNNSKALLYGAFAAMSRGETASCARTLHAHAHTESAAGDSPHHRKAVAGARWRAAHARRRRLRKARPRSRALSRASRGACHACAGSGQQGAGGRAAVCRGTRPASAGPAVRRQTAARDIPDRRRVVSGRRHAAVAPHLGGTASSRSWRVSPWAVRRPRPAATPSDKLVIMSARTDD